jgi:hypothetical protein
MDGCQRGADGGRRDAASPARRGFARSVRSVDLPLRMGWRIPPSATSTATAVNSAIAARKRQPPIRVIRCANHVPRVMRRQARHRAAVRRPGIGAGHRWNGPPTGPSTRMPQPHAATAPCPQASLRHSLESLTCGDGAMNTENVRHPVGQHLGATVATTTSTENVELVKRLSADVVVDLQEGGGEGIGMLRGCRTVAS